VLVMTWAVEGEIWAVFDLVWKYLLPAMSPSALLEDSFAQAELARKLAGLALAPPQGAAFTLLAAAVNGKTYRMEPNVLKIEAFSFDFGPIQSTLKLDMPAGQQVIVAGNAAWIEGRMGSSGLAANRSSAAGAGLPPIRTF